MKKYKTQIILSILFLVLLSITFVLISTVFPKKPKTVTYDMDATDSKHYVLGQTIKLDNISLIINGYTRLETKGKYELNMDCNEKAYQKLYSGYTFQLANNDKLLLRTNCEYRNNKIIVSDFSDTTNRIFNQIVIVDNSNLKIVATIALDKKEN